MTEVVRYAVNHETCTILGSRYKADSPCWTGLHFNGNEKLRTQSTIMLWAVGSDASYDLHLDVPWEHPSDWDGESEPDCIYRVRPIAEVGRRWRGRKVAAVDLERDASRSPPWVIIVTFEGKSRTAQADRHPAGEDGLSAS